MHYVDEGAGQPLLMLHGNPTWSFYYRHLIAGLRSECRVVAPDHIGCGFSEKPADYPYSLARRIEDLEEFIDSLDIESVDLLVHDWGGAIGLGWATRHPNRVRRTIVLNTAAFTGGPMPWRIAICRWPILGKFLVQRLNGFARAAIHMACVKRARMTNAVRAGYLFPYNNYENRRAIYEFVRDIPTRPGHPSYATLQQIEMALPALADVPMLICWGMKDFCFNEYFLNEWIRRFPKAEIHRFADAGHYVVEEAHEELASLIARFVGEEVLV